MLFNSAEFILFFTAVTLLFYLVPHKYRWMLLLAASCFFYMWFIPAYILILLVTILIDFTAGILIEQWADCPARRKRCLVVSIVSTCLVLFIFKYLNFCSENLVALAHHFGWEHPAKALNIILPIGLSFHTFQSLSYVIEVYRGNQKAERHFGYYSLYVMFYPQLVTGPIERPQNLLRQLHEEKPFKYDNLANGLRLILFGLVLKMVVADNLGRYVDMIYETPESYSSLDILTGLFFYSFQIYGDFFGYSSVALGCALCMGFTLVDNFKAPYLSGSIQTFWRRWHISLSTWFRDYLYIPLGGSRAGNVRKAFNLLVVFTVCGLWHGANWTFLLWGAAYGILMIAERALERLPLFSKDNPSRLVHAARVLLTFAIVTLLWAVFRAPSLHALGGLFAALSSNWHLTGTLHVDTVTTLSLVLAALLLWPVRHSRFDKWCGQKPASARWCIYAVLIFALATMSSIQQYPFIYFQF